MVVIGKVAICALQSTLSLRSLAFLLLSVSLLMGRCQNEDLLARTSKYLLVPCDFERIPGGGCQLRESYCSNHKCICKPDVPINIADRMCIARLRAVGEGCTFSQECQEGSFCAASGTHGNSICRCKWGHAYSTKSRQCVKGLKDSECQVDADCVGENIFCSLTVCDCMVGFEWFPQDQACHKKSRYGEPCENSVNCRAHDEFSACDPTSKQCTCGQFLSRKYALDEVTHKCVSCPSHRLHNGTKTCQPDRRAIDYGPLDASGQERNSHQFVYIALSMTPFIAFALIGFIYRYVNTSGNFADHFPGAVTFLEVPVLALASNPELDFCPVLIDLNGNALTRPLSDSQADLCILGAPTLPEPPPTYEIASKDLPPSYDEAVASRPS